MVVSRKEATIGNYSILINKQYMRKKKEKLKLLIITKITILNIFYFRKSSCSFKLCYFLLKYNCLLNNLFYNLCI